MISGISRFLQKILKYFNGTNISTSFVSSSPFWPVFFFFFFLFKFKKALLPGKSIESPLTWFTVGSSLQYYHHFTNILNNYCYILLTLSDTGFFWGSKTRSHSPILTFVLEQQWCSNLVSSFLSYSRVHKNNQNYELIQASRIITSSLPYMVKFFWLFSRHKHVIESMMTS